MHTMTVRHITSLSQVPQASQAGDDGSGRTLMKGRQTKAAIVNAALGLASQIGLEGLSIGALAEVTGMSKSGVFAHFGSREELQISVIREYHDRFEAEVFYAAMQKPRGLPRLQAMFDNWMVQTSAEIDSGCIYISGAVEFDDRSGPVRDALASSVATWQTALRRAVELAQAEGQLSRASDAHQIAFEIHGLILALHYEARFLRNPSATELARRGFLHILGRYGGPTMPPSAAPAADAQVAKLVAVPKTHALAKRKSIGSEELKLETMLLLGTGHCFSDQVLELARLFRGRLTALVGHWMRVGYCQGNFNSDNCAAGGYTLDYGPFGFCERFDPGFQPWTGGGEHFSFFNQPVAAEANFQMFWSALRPLLEGNTEALARLDQIREGCAGAMQQELEAMWARKLGLAAPDAALVNELLENAIKFRVPGTISVDCSLHQGNFELTVSNDTQAEVANRFQALIEEITSRDPGELLIERIEANAADENSSGSGLGLLTLMNDYGARLGWDFRSSATGGAVMLSTHAALTLN